MAYIRCDKDCNPVTPQPLHTDITQIVSCLTYEVYNKSYVRRDVDCEIADTQPDIKTHYTKFVLFTLFCLKSVAKNREHHAK